MRQMKSYIRINIIYDEVFGVNIYKNIKSGQPRLPAIFYFLFAFSLSNFFIHSMVSRSESSALIGL